MDWFKEWEHQWIRAYGSPALKVAYGLASGPVWIPGKDSGPGHRLILDGHYRKDRS